MIIQFVNCHKFFCLSGCKETRKYFENCDSNIETYDNILRLVILLIIDHLLIYLVCCDVAVFGKNIKRMSWIRENQKSRVHDFCVRVLKCGPIPRHVAIIMDGNRRFAQKNNFDRAKGHLLGFDKLAEVRELNSIALTEFLLKVTAKE